MKKTFEFYVELSKLIKTIPAPASVVFDVMTYKKACEDYQTALFYVGEILSNHVRVLTDRINNELCSFEPVSMLLSKKYVLSVGEYNTFTMISAD